MTTLYYSPGACSLSPHIVLNEVGARYGLEKVDLATHKTADGGDFYKINPKGYIPAFKLDSGDILTEGVAIVQYIADQHPGANLAPANGTVERARLQELLNFIATELHKSFGPLFNKASLDAVKQEAIAKIGKRLDHFEQILADGRDYLMGKSFSVADAYFFTIVNWTGHVGIALDKWPKIQAFQARVAARPSVQAALKAEGLIAA